MNLDASLMIRIEIVDQIVNINIEVPLDNDPPRKVT